MTKRYGFADLNHLLSAYQSVFGATPPEFARDRSFPEFDDAFRFCMSGFRFCTEIALGWDYGAPPTRVQILPTEKRQDQTIYLAKFIYPRDDSASLLFGFNQAGKITGIGLLGAAGD